MLLESFLAEFEVSPLTVLQCHQLVPITVLMSAVTV